MLKKLSLLLGIVSTIGFGATGELHRRYERGQQEQGIEQFQALMALPTMREYAEKKDALKERYQVKASPNEKLKALQVLQNYHGWIHSPRAAMIGDTLTAILTPDEIEQAIKRGNNDTEPLEEMKEAWGDTQKE